MAKFDNVEIGTRLYDIGKGYGEVIKINKEWLTVEFEDNLVVYDRDGIRFLEKYPALFWNKVKVVEE